MSEPTRQTVFISHANPADNDVARWIACKLSALGYSVWVDVEKFRGAESIWRTIEPVLRTQARCLILVLSRSTYGNDGLLRQGVANEMELALTLERDHPRFVLPWILDDLPFANLPIQLQNRMSVPERRWSAALVKIIEYLDSLRIVASPGSGPGAELLQRLLISEEIGVSRAPATYDLNRLECLSLPKHIYSIEEGSSLPENVATSNAYQGRKLSFHAIEGASRLFGKGEPIVFSLADSLENGIGSLALSPKDIRAVVVELTKKAFYAHLREKGLVERCRVKKSPVYFFNSSTVPGGKINVKLPENTRAAPRNLWGKHGDIFWHLGMEVLVTSPEGLVLTLSPHIIFTKDSVSEPLDDDPQLDQGKQHSRRRAIARRWFNDKWRGFFYPFLAFVREGDGNIQVSFKNNSPLVFAGTLSTLKVPATHVAVANLLPDDLVEPMDDEEQQDD
jgi:hypothetical protein